MRACMAASKASNPAQSTTNNTNSSKPSTDTKASGKSTEEAKKAVKDLLSANNNDRKKVMQIAKASGVTWKESDNDGINWMRASLAIQKHHESGKSISASSSDSKSDKNSDSTSGIKQLKPANMSTRDEFDIYSKVRKGELPKTPIGDSDKEMIKNLVPNYKSVLKESDTKCVAYSKNREYRFTKLSDSHFKCEVYEVSNKKDTSRPIKTSWYEAK